MGRENSPFRVVRESGVGDVVVVEKRGGRNAPIGVFADRDVAIEVLAVETDPQSVVVEDAMSVGWLRTRWAMESPKPSRTCAKDRCVASRSSTRQGRWPAS